jgi:hypothetical protein
MSNLHLFVLLFPMDYVKTVIIARTPNKLRLDALSIQEFFVWVGLWFYMSFFVGIDRRSWWFQSEPNMKEEAPFQFNKYMSKNHFEDLSILPDTADGR